MFGNGDGFAIKDRSTNRIVAMGIKKDGLYALVGESKDGFNTTIFFSSRFKRPNNGCWLGSSSSKDCRSSSYQEIYLS